MKFKFSQTIRNKQKIFIVLSGFILLVSIYMEKLTQELIDRQKPSILHFLFILLIFFCLSCFGYGKKYLETYIEKRGNFEGQAIVYKSILEKGDKVLFENGTGTTLYNVTEDIYQMLPWFSIGRIKLYIEILGLIILGMYMLSVNIKLGIIALSLIGVSIIVANFVSKYVAMQMNLKQFANSKLNQSLTETIKSISTIKQLRKLEYFGEKYNGFMDGEYKRTVRKVISAQTFYIVQLVLSQEMIPVIVLFIGVVSSVFGEATIGISIVMMDLSIRVSKSVQTIGDLLPQKHTAEKIKQRIESRVFDWPNDTKKQEKAGSFKSLTVEINSFSHEGKESNSLREIFFDLQRGDICICKGKSGSGKTTIFELIAKTLSKKELDGSILYNGIDIDTIATKDYYRHLLLVEQNTALIEGTLQENIVLGDTFPLQAIEEVVEVCALKSFIANRGIDFLIEDDGKNISGGEKQRIGLARFLLRRPEILLLDEVTSSLDVETRNEVAYRVIQYIRKYHMTLLVISHNNDFDKYANKFVEIK